MPKLRDVADMNINQVNRWISAVPHSLFYKKSAEEIVSELDYNEALRYLAALIVHNETNRSALRTISEEDSIIAYLNSDMRRSSISNNNDASGMKQSSGNSNQSKAKKSSQNGSSSFSSHNSRKNLIPVKSSLGNTNN